MLMRIDGTATMIWAIRTFASISIFLLMIQMYFKKFQGVSMGFMEASQEPFEVASRSLRWLQKPLRDVQGYFKRITGIPGTFHKQSGSFRGISRGSKNIQGCFMTFLRRFREF